MVTYNIVTELRCRRVKSKSYKELTKNLGKLRFSFKEDLKNGKKNKRKTHVL